MRYHYEKPDMYSCLFGKRYNCNHPIYDRCTLYLIDDRGLAVIQQRFDPYAKTTWWDEVDPWLVDNIYLNLGFKKYFDERAKTATDGLYPTVTVRQIMWALKLKPIKRERWETVFDRKDI